MILTCAFFPKIAGGLFYFEKNNAQYSLKPEDYALIVASKKNRFLNEPAKETAPMPSDDEDAAELITRDDDAADANNSTPPTPGPS